jgi:Ca-activated chloride channel family protein
VHVVGVGSAPNRSLTHAVARAGRGVEVPVGLDDDPAQAARRLLQHTKAPLVTALQVDGEAVVAVAPAAVRDVLAGAPARLALRLRAGGGTVRVRGDTSAGPFVRELRVAPVDAGAGEPAVVRLVGREQVEDLEAAIAAGRDANGCIVAIERIGLQFGIATRATSWLAIDGEPGVDPRAPRRVVEVPHQLPFGMSVEGVGLRRALPLAAPGVAMSMDAFDEAMVLRAPAPSSARGGRARGLGGLFGGRGSEERARPAKRAEAGPPPPRAPLPPQPVAATLRHRSGDTFVFELGGVRDWRLPSRVVLELADGSEVVAVVDAGVSTADGTVAAGASVRLVARVAGVAMPPVALRLGEHAGALRVPIA